ncbi:MAG: hypothetical protein AB8B87_10680 [Granulosicoccus sp.]
MSEVSDPNGRIPAETVSEIPMAGVVAVIGCDGSGKSTLSRWLADELGLRRESRFIYFGTGDGPGSLLIRTLNWLKSRSRFNHKASTVSPITTSAGHDGAAHVTASGNKTSSAGKRKAPDVLRLVWAAAALLDRRGKMRQLDRFVSQGMIVVTDRYPQAEFWGVHDGPRLGYLLETRSRGVMHTFARWEQAAYFKMVQRKPDLVLLLDVSVELAHTRRPEEPVDELKRRIHVAQSLRFQQATRVVLDASDPLEVVQQKALHAVINTNPHHDSEKMRKNAGHDSQHTKSDNPNVNVRSM